jgi:hypothetical protein
LASDRVVPDRAVPDRIVTNRCGSGLINVLFNKTTGPKPRCGWFALDVWFQFDDPVKIPKLNLVNINHRFDNEILEKRHAKY